MPETPLTPRQEASRRNGAKSRGPKTPEGKAKSSQNATKHGIFSTPRVALDTELRSDYNAGVNEMIQKHQPRDREEMAIMSDYSQSRWRLERCWEMETHTVNRYIAEVKREIAAAGIALTGPQISMAAFDRATDRSRCFANLSIYETRLRRAAQYAERRLDQFAARRREESANEPKTEPKPEPEPEAQTPVDRPLQPKPPQPEIGKNEPAKPALQLPGTARNKPCPCGSGRKYKRCCALPVPRAA